MVKRWEAISRGATGRRCVCRRLGLLLRFLLALATATIAMGADPVALGSWQQGRSTFFGADSWSIHQGKLVRKLLTALPAWHGTGLTNAIYVYGNAGSCGYGYIYPDEPLGWSVAALPDVSSEYPDSCGRCFEVACYPTNVTDGYGATVDRTGSCYDQDASIVVRVTDTCPCTFPPNAYSNKRWCCGDERHLELSTWAWERLADKTLGVIGVRYRAVPCDFTPTKVAALAPKPTPIPSSSSPPNSKRVARDWPEYWPESYNPIVIYKGGLQPPWVDRSYQLTSTNTTLTAISGGKAPMCATVQSKGAYAVAVPAGAAGAFQNRMALVLWLWVGSDSDGQQAMLARRTFTLVIGSPQGECRGVNIQELRPTAFRPSCTYCTDYWWRFEVFLSLFASNAPAASAQPQPFQGCSGVDAAMITAIEIRNLAQSQPICIDLIELL